MGFPTDPLVVRTELQLGGVWTDVTADVNLVEPITITRVGGRAGTGADTGRCRLQFRNHRSKINPNVIGRYSPRNPMSDLYGLIGRNTPVRVSVHAGDPYLDLDGDPANHASTADHASLDITGDIDIRAEAALDWHAGDLNQVLIAKWDATGNQRSYSLRVHDHLLTLNWSPDGTNPFFFSLTLPDLPERAAVRATLDVDDGAGGVRAVAYWAESLAGPWTQIGELTAALTTSIHAGTADLRVGGQDPTTTLPRTPFIGRGLRFEVRDGIDGTIVASPDFTTQAVGATSFADSAGRTWMVQGTAEITDRRERFVGEVSSWPPRWDVSGQRVWVTVEASGIRRRYGQGTKALDSTLRRRIPSDPDLVAYWPMEEDRDATQAYSPIPGVAPMAVSGLTFASDDTLAGSAALPQVGNPSSFSTSVPAATSGAWHVELVYNLEAMPGSVTTMLEIATTGTARTFRVRPESGTVQLKGYDAGGAEIFSLVPSSAPGFTGAWARLGVSAEPSGADVIMRIAWIPIGGEGLFVTGTHTGASAGRVTGVSGSYTTGLESLKLGHLAVFDTTNTEIYNFADHGFTGERAGTRMLRLAEEEGVPLLLAGYPGRTEAMGPQRPATLLDLLDECADADGGVLLERRDRAALRYRPRVTAYNRPVSLRLHYTGGGGREVAPPLEPVEDDQDVRNDRTVKRISGSSARAVDETSPLSVLPPPDGVGRYDDEVTLNLATDAQTEGHAWWLLHLGTWDEARYPAVTVNLAAAPHLIDEVLELDVWDRLQIANPPPWLPPDAIDQAVEGYTETLGARRWQVQYACAPAGPWNVAAVDLGYRADTDGSELAADIDTTQTNISVDVTAGPLWSTDPAEGDCAIKIGGELMTLTAVTGTTNPQTFTVTRSVNGVVKTHTAGTPVLLAQTPTVPL